MQYIKRSQYKITRTEHRVEFYVGGTADDFRRALDNVPPAAKLIDVEEDERRMDGSACLVFLEESKDD